MKAAVALMLAVMASACVGQSGASMASPAAVLSPSRPEMSNGGVIEYDLPAVSAPKGCISCTTMTPSGIAAGGDGSMWFADVGTDHIGRISANGAVTWIPVPGTGGGSGAIVAGPDGNIWSVARDPFGTQDWILRITPAGEVTKFQAGVNRAGNSGTGPTGIAVGPDQNLWFTELWTDRIGRMTPQGDLTEFGIPTLDSEPQGIAAGPDGNLWFTESSQGHVAVARITPAGAITEFPIAGASPDLDPTSIITGPDHNLWFSGLGEVDRVTTTGAVTRFPGVGTGGPVELAGGPDGNVWFADADGDSVGSLSLDGRVVHHALPRPFAKPSGIAVGHDGRMWFTEAGAVRVASIGVTVPEVKLSSHVIAFATAAQVETLSNDGDGPLRIASVRITGPDAVAFRVSHDECSGRTLAPGASCQLRLSNSSGSGTGFAAARLEIADNATGTPQVVSLVARLTTCRLPVVASSLLQGPVAGGFLSVPGGPFVADSSAQLPALTYDARSGKWLPVPKSWISQDGKRYVDATQVTYTSFQLHVVDLTTGADHAIGKPDFYTPLAFTKDGIYVHIAIAGAMPGLWLVDPDTGATHQLLVNEVVQAISEGAQWVGVVDARDPHPHAGVFGFSAPDSIVRRDASTGQTETWLYRPGEDVEVLATSGGRLLVSGTDDLQRAEYWIVSSPTQADALPEPEIGPPLWFPGMVADSEGVWLGSLSGVYLWTPRTGAVLVSDNSPFTVAGGCA